MVRLWRPGPPGSTEGLVEPLAGVLRAVLAFVGLFLALGVIVTVVGSGSIAGLGHQEVCVPVPNELGQPGTEAVPRAVEVGVRSYTDVLQMCVQHPTIGQRLLSTVADLAIPLIYLTTMVLLARSARTAERYGPFTARAVRGVTRAGWLLLLGALAAAVVEGVGRAALLATMVTYPTLGGWLNETQLPFGLMITGAGLLTVARILRAGATMREEIEATV
jgi:hypothetical protein